MYRYFRPIALILILVSQLFSGWNQSLSRWEADCATGLSTGCSIAGGMYEKGILVTWNGKINVTSSMQKDNAKALKLYRKGCDLGDELLCKDYKKLSTVLSQNITADKNSSSIQKTKTPPIKTQKVYNLLSKKLYNYGNSASYGFKNSKYTAMKHEVLGFYPISTLDSSTQLVITSSKPIKGQDCHACAPKMSFFILKIVDSIWVLDKSYINANSMGSWGSSPDKKAYQIIKLSPDEYGIFLKVSGTGQGYLVENIFVYRFGKTKVKQIFQAEAGIDDSATGHTSRDIWSAKFELKKGSEKYYDIVLHKQGIADSKSINQDIIYHFDGEKYTIYSNNKNLQITSKDIVQRQYISTPMINGGRAVATVGKDSFKFEFVGDGDMYETEVTQDSFHSIHMLAGYATCKRENNKLLECNDFGSKSAIVRYHYDGQYYECEIDKVLGQKRFKEYFYNDETYLYWASYREDKVVSLQKFKIASRH